MFMGCPEAMYSEGGYAGCFWYRTEETGIHDAGRASAHGLVWVDIKERAYI